VVTVLILLYPKIFKADQFKDIRDEEGRISVAVMPFQNLSGDTLYTGLGLGLQNLLITGLSNSDELSVQQMQTMYEILGSTGNMNFASMTPTVASDLAQKLEASTVILGSLHKSGNNLRLTANLLDSQSKKIYTSFEIDGDAGDDFFALADSLTKLIKNHLEIKVMKRDMDLEVDFYANTGSAEAFLYFTKGVIKFFAEDYPAARNLMHAALKTDPDFFNAEMILMVIYLNTDMVAEAREVLQKLKRHLDNCSYEEQLQMNVWTSMLEKKNPRETIDNLKVYVDEFPQVRGWMYNLGMAYSMMDQYSEAIEAYERTLEIDKKWGSGWNFVPLYSMLGRAYHLTGQHEKEKAIYELGLRNIPNNCEIISRQAICALSMGDSLLADEYMDEFSALRSEQDSWSDALIKNAIGVIYQQAQLLDKAEYYFRAALTLDPSRPEPAYHLATIFFENNIHISEGMELIDHALEIVPDHADYQHTKGLGLLKAGHYTEALLFLEQSWELKPYYDPGLFQHIQEAKQALAKEKL
jgi:tetratricopeptide (TPR) repeat protein